MADPAETRVWSRNDLAWAIFVAGTGVVSFAIVVALTWYFAATLFLIFAGILLGVALNAMTDLLGRVVRLPHWLRLAMVCLLFGGFFSGVIYLGGATIVEQATALSGTIKAQIVHVKGFLERHGIDTSYFELPTASGSAESPGGAQTRGIPAAGALASSGGAIISQTVKLLLGTVSAVGNIFILVFLGLAFAAQPSVYRRGLLYLAPAKHRRQVAIIIDRISETLGRWLIAQMITMSAVFVVTWIGLVLIGIPSSFILSIQAGLLTFIPTVGAIIAGLIVVLASLASGCADQPADAAEGARGSEEMAKREQMIGRAAGRHARNARHGSALGPRALPHEPPPRGTAADIPHSGGCSCRFASWQVSEPINL